MSLDIHLTSKVDVGGPEEEWVGWFDYNITHNLGKMAGECKFMDIEKGEVDLYTYLWRPEEYDITKAQELIIPLETALPILKNNQAFFEKFNPSNGWGDYDGLVSCVEDYLEACKRYPKADIEVSR